jgi:17beta-estradiol 17-dehydrogenase/3beta-hydroxysteroid 3-dehydrogenase
MGVIKERVRSAIDASAGEATPFRQQPPGGDNIFAGSSDDDQPGALVLDHNGRTRSPTPISEFYASALATASPRRVRPPRSRPAAIPCDTTPKAKKRSGAKKSRRYENHLTLTADLESELNEVTLEDLSPNRSRTFGRLLEESELLEIWNCFEEKDIQMQGSSPSKNEAATSPFNGICRKLRTMLKQRHLPLGLMDNLEETLLEYFVVHPLGTFESCPMDAFRRGLLHALSQYNNLCSHSIGSVKNKKIVRVQNKQSVFNPPPVRLVQFIEERRNGAEGGSTGTDE